MFIELFWQRSNPSIPFGMSPVTMNSDPFTTSRRYTVGFCPWSPISQNAHVVVSVAAAQVQSAVGTNLAGHETQPACVHSAADMIVRQSTGLGPVLALLPEPLAPVVEAEVEASPLEEASLSPQDRQMVMMSAIVIRMSGPWRAEVLGRPRRYWKRNITPRVAAASAALRIDTFPCRNSGSEQLDWHSDNSSRPIASTRLRCGPCQLQVVDRAIVDADASVPPGAAPSGPSSPTSRAAPDASATSRS